MLIPFISLLILFVTAQNPPNIPAENPAETAVETAAEKCPDGKTFKCGDKPFDCNETDSIGCKHFFAKDEHGQWIPSGVEGIVFPGAKPLECQFNDTTLTATCYTDGCGMNGISASALCLKKVNVTCDNKPQQRMILKSDDRVLRCFLVLTNNEKGPLKQAYHAKLVRAGVNSTCVPGLHKKPLSIELPCGLDDCEKNFNISHHLEKCGAAYLECGDSEKIFSTARDAWCLMSWKREGEGMKKEKSRFFTDYALDECPVYSGEAIEILCNRDCRTMNDDRRDKEVCAEKLASNEKTREAILITFPVVFFLVLVAVGYASGCWIRRARKTHSLLMQEYQLEFGSTPKSTSDSKKQRRKKKKKEGGMERKGGEVPF